MRNLYQHIRNIKEKFGLNVIVAINRYNTDTVNEIEFIQKELENKNIEVSLVEGWAKGGEGAIDIAQKLTKLVNKEENFKFIYEDNDNIQTKIKDIAGKIYGAEDVEFSEEAKKSIKQIENIGYEKLPICIAKTQYSFSDDATNLECKEPFKITIREVNLKAGAGFVVAIAGKIMTMPGLPRVPAAENIDIDENGNVEGIF